MTTQNVKIKKVHHAIQGNLSFPGDKSLSHRAIIFGSLASGRSRFTNVLAGEDCVCTRKAFEEMGVEIYSSNDSSNVDIHGKGLLSLKTPKKELYLGNSGTSMRLLLGLLSAQNFETTLTGDPSLSSRPMRRVTDFLKQMGAVIEGKDNANFAPLTVKGAPLKGIDAVLPIPSAQVKSAILLAGLYAQGATSVTEPVKSRDHTEKFLKYFGAQISEEGLKVSIQRGQQLEGRTFEIAGDISSAAFFMAIAALLPETDLAFRSVLWNPTRTGIIDVLKRMGIEFGDERLRLDGPELTADFKIRTRRLRAFEIKREELPSLIDEIPILTVLATQAHGRSIVHEADELRVKETDRIQSMVSNLSKMGAKIQAQGNTLIIDGPTPLRGAEVDSFKDHRTAMSLIVAGMIAEGETAVKDVECINTSFPTFFKLLDALKISYESR